MMDFVKPLEPTSHRQLRASEVIKKAIAKIFVKGKHFDRYLMDKSITISRVKTSIDLKHAFVYVWPLGKVDKDIFCDSLASITPMIRKVLTREINFKFSPQIHFHLDDNFEHAIKIDKLLSDLQQSK